MRWNGISLAAVCCAGLFVGRPVHADVIYDNTTTSTGSTSFTQLEIGDEVNAAAIHRDVWTLYIGVTQQGFSGTADLQARLYANDGPGGEPGTLLWESTVYDDVPLSGDPELIAFHAPAIIVPDTFTWTIQISDTHPVAVGVPHFDPPASGTSPAYAWFGRPGSWTRLSDPGGRPVNFMAWIIAGVDCSPCDMNCDGTVDAFDIEPFLGLLFSHELPCNVCAGDVNGDGVVDAFDIEPFLECLFP